ncbi:MAG: aminopeptidase [Spirochaetia bacterium]|nr:aminopeptidase [Spirochaetia bacterium]
MAKLNKTRTKIIIYLIFLILGFLSVYFFIYIEYAFHLVKHQVHVLISHEPLEKIESNLTENHKTKIKIFIEAKEYGKNIYNLKKSNVYESFVKLPREKLGWNLTAAYPLELKAKEFYFPFIGKFGYLGFFSESLLKKWKNNYIQNNFDTYENEIAAYSTIGFFNDPVFSTYLEYSDYFLLRLIFHEMAHEKLFFDEDTEFSEGIASFIEKVMVKEFLKNKFPDKKNIFNINENLNINNSVNKEVNTLEEKLKKLFSSNKSDSDKLKEKKLLYEKFRKKIEILDKNKDLQLLTKQILKMKDLNNAWLIQYKRYRPHQSGFNFLLKECNDDIICWFRRLEKLKSCSKENRNILLSQSLPYSELLKKCQNN